MSLYPKKSTFKRTPPAKVADATPAGPPDNHRTFDARPKPSQTEKVEESARNQRRMPRLPFDNEPRDADGEA